MSQHATWRELAGPRQPRARTTKARFKAKVSEPVSHPLFVLGRGNIVILGRSGRTVLGLFGGCLAFQEMTADTVLND